MKENNLYKHIVYALFNLFSQDKLKGWIILEEQFKKMIIKEICNLLTLEKSFDCQLNDAKYAKAFAQVLADVTGESETIEKDDNPNFQKLDEEYVEFIKYVTDTYKVDKEQLTAVNNSLSVEQVDGTSEFATNKDDLLKKLKEEKTANSLKQNDDNSANQNIPPQAVIPPVGAGVGATMGGPFNNSFFTGGMPGMMPGGNNFLTHPKLDERFYPYDRKPKHIFLLKQIFAWLSIIIFCLVLVFIFLTNFAKIDEAIKIIVYKDGKNNSYIWGPGSESLPSPNGYSYLNFAPPLAIFFKLTYIIGILILLISGYTAYSILAPKRYKQEKYLVSRFNLGLALIIYLLLFGMLIASIIPSYVNQLLTGSAITDKNKVDNVTPYHDVSGFINNLTHSILNSSTYKIGLAIAIIICIFAIIAVILGVAIFIIAPRLDRNKLILAETEYQKMVAAAMKGQKYEPNSSLFDEEFRQDKDKTANGDENNNS